MKAQEILTIVFQYLTSNGNKLSAEDKQRIETSVTEGRAGNFGAIIAELSEARMGAVRNERQKLGAAALLLLAQLKGEEKDEAAQEHPGSPEHEDTGDDSDVYLINDKPDIQGTSSSPEPYFVDDDEEDTDDDDTDIEGSDDIFTDLSTEDDGSGASMLGIDIDTPGDGAHASYFSSLGEYPPAVGPDFGIKLNQPSDDGLSLEEEPTSTDFQSHIQSIIEQSDSLREIQRDWTLIFGNFIAGTMLFLTIIAWVIMGSHYSETVKRQNELDAKVILNDTLIQTLRAESSSEKDLLYYKQRDALFAERDKALTKMLNGVEYKANLILADKLLLELEKLRNEWIANK